MGPSLVRVILKASVSIPRHFLADGKEDNHSRIRGQLSGMCETVGLENDYPPHFASPIISGNFKPRIGFF